jgi:L-rhamnose-H+ transport protein
VILLGGFVTNGVWCLILSLRNRTAHEFLNVGGSLLVQNILLCVVAGSLWYLQSLFYGMGETTLGRYRFAGWSVLMVCIIIFSNLWGLAFKEWTGTSANTKRWLLAGLAVLVVSALMTSYGSYLATYESRT